MNIDTLYFFKSIGLEYLFLKSWIAKYDVNGCIVKYCYANYELYIDLEDISKRHNLVHCLQSNGFLVYFNDGTKLYRKRDKNFVDHGYSTYKNIQGNLFSEFNWNNETLM